MTTQNEKKIAQALREAADKIDPPVNQASPRPKASTSQAAQQAHQEALESYQTKREGSMRLSEASRQIDPAKLKKQISG